MKSTFAINIQSFSDIITNSSSELFCINDGNKEICNLLETIFKDWNDKRMWSWGGEACGCEIETIKEQYENLKNFDEQYIIYYNEWTIENYEDFLNSDINKYIEYDKYGAFVKLKELSFEEYILFQNLYDKQNYTENTIFFRIDYGNHNFIEHLNKNLGLETIEIE